MDKVFRDIQNIQGRGKVQSIDAEGHVTLRTLSYIIIWISPRTELKLPCNPLCGTRLLSIDRLDFKTNRFCSIFVSNPTFPLQEIRT